MGGSARPPRSVSRLPAKVTLAVAKQKYEETDLAKTTAETMSQEGPVSVSSCPLRPHQDHS